MKVTTFPAPPKEFNPVTGSDKELAQYGYPRRPDPVKEPVLRKLWDQHFTGKHTLVRAELVEDTVWHTVPHGAPKKPGFGLGGDWGGAVVKVALLGLNPPEPANTVFAEWVVPKITPKPTEPGSQTVGFWVGLGGFGTSQVLQAGTAATLSGTSVNYWAWTEWFPAGYKVANLVIEPGDLISVLVCAPESDHGYVSMMNHRTGIAISVGVSDPSGTTPYDGSSVEWVIEAINTEVPNFGSVTFTQVTAGTQNHTIDLTHAFTINTTNGSKTLATGKILASKDEVEVIWDAAI